MRLLSRVATERVSLERPEVRRMVVVLCKAHTVGTSLAKSRGVEVRMPQAK